MSQASFDLEARVAALEAARAPNRLRRHINRRRVAVLLVAISLAAPAVVLASHRFTDVPDSNTFHGQISVLADSGITKGCNLAQTMYCPAQDVRRDAMAGFLTRGLGRMNSTTFVFPTVADGSAVTSTTIRTEGTATIHAIASFYILMDASGTPSYPCERLTYLSVDGSDVSATPGSYSYGQLTEAPASTEAQHLTSQAAFVVAGGNHTVSLISYGSTGGDCDQVYGRGILTATVVPFSSTGGTPAKVTAPAGDRSLGSTGK